MQNGQAATHATPQDAFEGAAEYTAESLANYGHLAAFVRRRQAIEEEYARSLRKLCKSVSLIPHQQEQAAADARKRSGRRGFFTWLFGCGARARRTSLVGPTDEGRSESDGQSQQQQASCEGGPLHASSSSLWQTFFELVDDTAQVAKSHAALADALETQLVDPLTAAQREMENARRSTVAEGIAAARDLARSGAALHRAHTAYQDAVADAGRARVALDALVRRQQSEAPGAAAGGALPPAAASKEAAARDRLRRAEEAAVAARHALRLQEESHRSLHGRTHAQDLPRLLCRLQSQEHQRARDVLAHLHGLTDLERRCAAMNDAYGQEMAGRLRAVDIGGDERAFVAAYLSAPLPPPPVSLLPSQPSASGLFPMRASHEQIAATTLPTVDEYARAGGSSSVLSEADLPRTASMPPAYESQEPAGRAVTPTPSQHAIMYAA